MGGWLLLRTCLWNDAAGLAAFFFWRPATVGREGGISVLGYQTMYFVSELCEREEEIPTPFNMDLPYPRHSDNTFWCHVL